MSGRPVIGISAAVERARWAVWDDVEVNISQRTYTRRVDESGGLPLLLPTSAAGTAEPEAVLAHVDGLILTGGADLDPVSYGAEPDPRTTNTRRERDAFEIAIARAAIERDLPLLGICRGFEILNVALGGTLEQHLADAELHLHTPGQFSDHAVRLEPGSLVARLAGAERLDVRSHHHQGIGELGDGLVPTGWAEPGGVVEAIELPHRRATVGILWHTEEETMSAIVGAFVEMARSVTVGA
jgi:putative glutamine amidotransferase